MCRQKRIVEKVIKGVYLSVRSAPGDFSNVTLLYGSGRSGKIYERTIILDSELLTRFQFERNLDLVIHAV